MSAPILITGLGKRLGLALARYCLSIGQPVIGTYRSEHPALQDLREAGVELFHCDFYKADDVENLIAEVTKRHSSLRAVVHNASDWLSEASSAESPALMIGKMMQVHACVPYQLNIAFGPLLCAYSGGMADLIHITDYVTKKGSKKHIAYAASKAALENMTLSFAASLAPDVKVNAIAPALVLFNEGDDEQYKKKAVTKALIQKQGGEQEVISAFSYLLASDYVTGRIMHVDGGRHLR